MSEGSAEAKNVLQVVELIKASTEPASCIA